MTSATIFVINDSGVTSFNYYRILRINAFIFAIFVQMFDIYSSSVFVCLVVCLFVRSFIRIKCRFQIAPTKRSPTGLQRNLEFKRTYFLYNVDLSCVLLKPLFTIDLTLRTFEIRMF